MILSKEIVKNKWTIFLGSMALRRRMLEAGLSHAKWEGFFRTVAPEFERVQFVVQQERTSDIL